MPCCIGSLLNTVCDEDYEPFDVTDWSEDRRNILSQRVTHEIHAQKKVEIANCCSLHFLNFVSEYETYQVTQVGCCNPFLLHQPFQFSDIQKITGAFVDSFKLLALDVIEGRQICQSCVDQLLKKLDGNNGITLNEESNNILTQFIPKHYDYESIQRLYESCLTESTDTFEKILKPLQAEVLFNILKQKDVLCVLPTNYGKTLPMVMANFILAKKSHTKPICLIISPLKLLMSDLTDRLKKYRLKSIQLNLKALHSGAVKKFIDEAGLGDPLYLVSSPETLQISQTREILALNFVSFIMVDECHLSSEWGKNFRKDYANIHEIRQFLDCPLALFTATLSECIKREVISNTGMRKNEMVIIADNPDRPEIFLELRIRKSLDESLRFLADEAISNGGLKKTLVFVNPINKTHNCNIFFRSMLQDKGRIRKADHDRRILGYLSEHFSSVTAKKTRIRIQKDFGLAEGLIKVLFSTVSYGLGVDNRYINRVLILDTDNIKSSLWQKISRSCRDGNKGKAIIYVNSDKFTEQTFFKVGVCLRHTILTGFTGYVPNNSVKKCKGDTQDCLVYNCCTHCRSTCSCSEIMVVDELEDFSIDNSQPINH